MVRQGAAARARTNDDKIVIAPVFHTDWSSVDKSPYSKTSIRRSTCKEVHSRPTNKNLGTAAATRAAEETFLSNQVSERNYSGVAGWSLIPLRLVLGYGFMVHGWAKWSRGTAGVGRLLEQTCVPCSNVCAWVGTLPVVV